MLNENIVFTPNYSTKYKLEVPNVNERICFINHRAGDVSDWLWFYDYLFTRVVIRIPLTSFQQEILRQSGVAPSQLHPNSWAFIRSFELVCQALGLPVSWRLFFFFFKLIAPKNANMDDSGRGFLSFRAHGKMKIFDFSDESSSFKEMYFKVFGAPKTQPFFLDSEKKARFHLFWCMGYRSPRPGANELSEKEKNAVSLVQTIWGKEHLAIKNLMCDNETAKKAILEHSPSKKRKRVQKEAAEESSNSLNLLERGFDPIPFIDQYLMTSETEKGLVDLEADDRLMRVQRMLLRVIVYCRDVQRENAEVPRLPTLLSKKEESNKSLGSRVTDLEFEDEKRALEEGKRATEKKVTELLASLKKAQEDLASMEKMKEEAETLAMNGVSEIEENVVEQVRLLAPGVDFSKVSAYNNVVDG
ncbi:hypothetical protein PIB30_051046 [Stylosanthes scabra]|uniref:Transposase (putative) gypsy type domain-containing protein n=1 Tax=Stylosanthes scabra TaxID=79078 RepID=A0ABU6QIK3_9FABA|nr:hypothetical protein [Stylosanthes scabra]